jgi:hypothetical protein
VLPAVADTTLRQEQANQNRGSTVVTGAATDISVAAKARMNGSTQETAFARLISFSVNTPRVSFS